MAAVAFDTLKAARRMIAAGIPREQAETQAELMAEAFVFHMDQLVTKDYLDAQLDARFAEQDARIDARFAKVESTQRLHSWMLAIITASTLLPALLTLFSGR